MDENVARKRLARGLDELQATKSAKEKRERYLRGDQDLPYAPPGVTAEYVALQEMAIANWIVLAVASPVQRIRGDSFTTHISTELDDQLWRNVWQANKLDSRQSLPYRDLMTHGRGIMSVWPNLKNRARPIVRPESADLVYVHPDDDDPFTPDWSVKVFTVQDTVGPATALLLPSGFSSTRTVGIVYDSDSFMRFERGGSTGFAEWTVVKDGTHPMGEVPHVTFDYRPDSKGQIWSPMDQLIPQQDAINTIRFNTLLAMQFSAYRQRVVTGFDPVVYDAQGRPVVQLNDDGTPVIGPDGKPVPVLKSPGRPGVDRLLAFPGAETKVFDLPESNLGNYITVLGEFLTQFFATGQIPPQYLLSRMANLSGDALTGAESTLASLIQEIQLIGQESNEDLMRRGAKCAGLESDFPDAEMNYGDAEAKSFAQITDGIVKLIGVDFPHRAAFAMLPGATKQKVDDWMNAMEDEAFANQLALASRGFTDASELTGPVGGTASGSAATTVGPDGTFVSQ